MVQVRLRCAISPEPLRWTASLKTQLLVYNYVYVQYFVFPTAWKKGRVPARKKALLMREIHPKGHFC